MAVARRASARDAPMLFKTQAEWAAWLAVHGAASRGVWLRIAKRGSGRTSVSHPQALDVALSHGWIDGQKKGESEDTWLQRFTPRTRKSIWSKVNRENALRLIREGRMHTAGLAEVERAKRDGRWAAAYDSWSTATVPPDLQAALDANKRAKAFFATLGSRNRYAVL